jgi:hypothetical protein
VLFCCGIFSSVFLSAAQSDASVHHFSLLELTESKVNETELHVTQVQFTLVYAAYNPVSVCVPSVQVTAHLFGGSDGMVRGNCSSVLTVKLRRFKVS